MQSDLTWSRDFVSDSLSNAQAIRTLNILDDYNREALWIEIDTSIWKFGSLTPTDFFAHRKVTFSLMQCYFSKQLSCDAIRYHLGIPRL